MKKFTIIFFIVTLLTIEGSDVANAQRITMTIAGDGITGYSGDNGPGKLAKIGTPEVVCSDPAGNVYFVDANKIRQVSVRTGIITTIAGGGTSTANGIPATNASMTPTRICCDPLGNIYVVTGPEIRIINPATDIINTYAGTGASGYSGDGGAAISAAFSNITGIISDASGNIYIVDNGNHRIRKINGTTTIVTTIAGTGSSGYTGDGGPATAAAISNSQYIGCTISGDVYFIDQGDIYVRKITAATGYISTYAGGGGTIAGCLALNTDLSNPSGMCVNSANNVCFNETSCSCREINNITDSTLFIGGNYSTEGYKDDTNSLYAWLNTNYGIISDANDNIYIADDGNARIRKLIKLTTTPTFAYGQGQTITPCPGYGYIVDSLLAITDLDSGQNETWSLVTAPLHGSLTGLSASAFSNGTYKTTKPTGVTYTPSATYTGVDSFMVNVSDGTSSNTFTIYASVQMASPGIITGSTNVCMGSSATLSETTGFPGAWSASNAKATINSAGTVTGVTAGTDTITYTLTATCPLTATQVITINALPTVASITGVDTVCKGATIPLTDSTGGGVWSTDYGGYMTIGSNSGIVTGVSYGQDYIYYTVTSAAGCINSTATLITGMSIADPVSGASSVCDGASIPLYEDISGGTWSASNSNAAITGSGTTISLTGLIPGKDTVIYTNTNMCGTGDVKMTVTVNPLVAPGTVTGPTSVCIGAEIDLTASIPGGTWTDANGDVFTFGSGSTGYVDGETAGVDTVYYTSTCASSAVAIAMTVDPLPGGTISGPAFVCLGSTIVLSDVTPGGTWIASNSNATIISTGAASASVTGVTYGTDIISYTSTNVCGTGTVVTSISIDTSIASSGTISGASAVCTGATIDMTHTVSGGTWSTTNADAAISASGIVTGISAGIDTIVYTATCALTNATEAVTINPSPAIGIISGTDTVCVGSTAVLSDPVSDGIWTSSHTFYVSIGSTSGIVTGVSLGSTTIKYTTTNAWCTSIASVSLYANTPAGAISGTSPICLGGTTTTFADAVSGGTWSATNGNATVSSTGIVTPVAIGTDTIIYVNTNSCGTATVSKTVSVNPLPSPAVLGPSSVCMGSSITLTSTTTGGRWSSINADATAGIISGVIHGVAAGIDSIKYTINTGTSCEAITEVPMTVGEPDAGVITGLSSVCAGSSIILSDAAGGGTWSLSNSNASISGTGLVTGISAGIDSVIYTVSSTCGTATTSTVIDINSLPDAGAITGPGSLCIGASITMSDGVVGGSWSVSNTDASISGPGIIEGISAGIDSVLYTVTNACGTAVISSVIYINTLPDAGTITGPGSVCAGSLVTMADATGGGVWSLTNTDASVSGSGIIEGISAGIDSVLYTVTNACGTAVISSVIDIYALPDAGTITGPGSVCAGSSVTMADATGGGVWSLANTDASVSGSGIISGITAGADSVIYSVTNSCGTTSTAIVININSLPDAGTITGADTLCIGSIATLTDPAIGGTWAVSNNNTSISSLGIVTSNTTGLDTVIYTLTNSCGTATTQLQIVIENCNNTSIATHNATPGINIYPNPTTSLLNIDYYELPADKVSVYITDVAGRIVLTNKFNNSNGTGNVQINVSSLEEGVYLLTVNSSTINYTGKLVITK